MPKLTGGAITRRAKELKPIREQVLRDLRNDPLAPPSVLAGKYGVPCPTVVYWKRRAGYKEHRLTYKGPGGAVYMKALGFSSGVKRHDYLLQHAQEIIDDYHSIGIMATCHKWHTGHTTVKKLLKERLVPIPGTFAALVDKALEQEKDPRDEMWEGCMRERAQFMSEIEHLKSEVAALKAALVDSEAIRAKFALENERLKVKERQLDEVMKEKLRQQARGAMATSGENSLAEKP